MKILLLLTVVFLCAAPLQATTLTFNVDPALTGHILPGMSIDLHSSELNGTTLNGQALSIDAVLANDLVARAYLLNSNTFVMALEIFTTAKGMPGWPGESTAFIFDLDGKPISTPFTTGGSISSSGSFTIGYAPLDSANPSGGSTFDIHGLHVDTILPTSGQTVTDVSLRIVATGNALAIGTPAQLPEPSSLILLGCGIVGLAAARRRFQKEA